MGAATPPLRGDRTQSPPPVLLALSTLLSLLPKASKVCRTRVSLPRENVTISIIYNMPGGSRFNESPTTDRRFEICGVRHWCRRGTLALACYHFTASVPQRRTEERGSGIHRKCIKVLRLSTRHQPWPVTGPRATYFGEGAAMLAEKVPTNAMRA